MIEKKDQKNFKPKMATIESNTSRQKNQDHLTQREQQNQKLSRRMKKIKHKIAIISGKGGVGKSTIAANLAMAFAAKGHENKIGILDADITGPCIPKILGVRNQKLLGGPPGLFPATGPYGMKVASMDFLLPTDESPVIWRGPLKMRAIQQFLSDIVWGDLDFLFIDLPPGTGDEPLSVMQLLPELDGVIIVTIPSEVSQMVVKKAVTFSRQLKIPIIGILENMSGFVCPHCGEQTAIFSVGGGEKISKDLSVPYLGKIPIDPEICQDSDKGVSFIVAHPNSTASKEFAKIVEKIENFLSE